MYSVKDLVTSTVIYHRQREKYSNEPLRKLFVEMDC